VGIATSLLFPSEALWRRATFEMQSPFGSALQMTPFSTLSVPNLLMVVYAVLYLLAALAAAVWIFKNRDM
jgi:ABC-type transport system involved in multi-copper enzyme maturation permease subunit